MLFVENKLDDVGGRKEEQRISALGNSKFNINNHMMSEFQLTSMNCVSRLEVVHSPVTLLSQKAWHSRWAYTIVANINFIMEN